MATKLRKKGSLFVLVMVRRSSAARKMLPTRGQKRNLCRSQKPIGALQTRAAGHAIVPILNVQPGRMWGTHDYKCRYQKARVVFSPILPGISHLGTTSDVLEAFQRNCWEHVVPMFLAQNRAW